MDGYAVAEHGEQAAWTGRQLRLVGRTHAGAPPPSEPLQAGEAWRVFTGAMVPPNATRVLLQEDIEQVSSTLTVTAEPNPDNAYIRPAAFDFAAGQLFFCAGHRLTVRDIGLLAALDFPYVEVFRQPRVGILSTGDEVQLPGEPRRAGQIASANGHALMAAVQAFGGLPTLLPCGRDDMDALKETIITHSSHCDMIVSSGGVSVGDKDHVAAAVAAAGFEIAVHGIAMQPGKPVLFAQTPRDHGSPTVFMGMPGNPVSVMVSAAFFMAPFLRLMAGEAADAVLGGEAAFCSAILGCDLGRGGKRTAFMRAYWQQEQAGRVVVPYAHQDSSLLRLSVESEILLVHPAGSPARRARELVQVLPYPASVYRM